MKNYDDVVRDVAAQLDYDYVKCVSPLGIGGSLAFVMEEICLNMFSL